MNKLFYRSISVKMEEECFSMASPFFPQLSRKRASVCPGCLALPLARRRRRRRRREQAPLNYIWAACVRGEGKAREGTRKEQQRVALVGSILTRFQEFSLCTLWHRVLQPVGRSAGNFTLLILQNTTAAAAAAAASTAYLSPVRRAEPSEIFVLKRFD